MSQIKVTQFPSSWEEGCPKGGVVGDQERPKNHIPKEFFSYLPPPPPSGTPPPGRRRAELLLLLNSFVPTYFLSIAKFLMPC